MTGARCIVVDASVAINWAIQEPFTQRARALIQQAVESRTRLLAPHFMPAEAANGLYLLLWTGNLDQQEVLAALEDVERMPVALATTKSHPKKSKGVLIRRGLALKNGGN